MGSLQLEQKKVRDKSETMETNNDQEHGQNGNWEN